jgi:hypothetical protein
MAVLYGSTTNRPIQNITGTTRWNTTTNTMEVFDGAKWIKMALQEERETMSACVQVLEDQIAVRIEEEYKDNAAIQDAFEEWEEANKRFRVVLELAEKK